MQFYVKLSDQQMHEVIVKKQWFYSIAKFNMPEEHMFDIGIPKEPLTQFKKDGVDLFTFIDRSFLINNPAKDNLFTDLEPMALLTINTYDKWQATITHNARWQTKKARKMGLTSQIVQVDDAFLKSAQKIYNETPVRQGRRYTGYGLSLDYLRNKYSIMDNSEIIGVFYQNEMIGLMWIGFGDRVAAVKSFVSLLSYRNKYPNDLLIDSAVQRCLERGYNYLTYWNMGYNPGLDFFKKSHGFKVFKVPRYYFPITSKGELALKLNMYRPLDRTIPKRIVQAFLPVYNSINRLIPSSILSYVT
jgi:hypothetical protein